MPTLRVPSLMAATVFSLAALCVASGPAAHAVEPNPLTVTALPEVFGQGATLELRARADGLDVFLHPGSFAAGPGAPGTGRAPTPNWVSFRLLDARGRGGSELELALPPAGNPVHVRLMRPFGAKEADADLRLQVTRAAHGAEAARAWITPVARFLRAPRAFLLGDSSAYAGTTYAPRVVVRGYPGATISAALVAKNGKTEFAARSATADDTGTASLALAIPEKCEGNYIIRVAVTHPDGNVTTEFPLQVLHGARVLLSTDKPIYQPGQRIYLRLLARAVGNGHAAGQAPATVAIFDAKNNKIFQTRGKTSAEGVFAATLDIATMVNTGRWRIEAEVDKSKVARTIDVKPYVLPKFKVELGAERGAYRPGETVHGTVSGRYFFGEPLKGAAVTLTAETFDVAPRELAKLTFKLDDTGAHAYELALPDVLTGQPLLQGAASVRLTAHVVDTAGQSYDGDKTLTVYQDALRIVAMPEAGRLVPGVENLVYVVVTTPDGAPAARASVTLNSVGPLGRAPATLTTDARGIAEWRVVPADGNLVLIATAKTPDGATSQQTLTLSATAPSQVHVLLRPRDPAPQAGSAVAFDVFVQGAVPYVFLDLIKDGQTLVTLAGPVTNGQAHLETTVGPEAAGTVLAHAYAIGTDMEVYADTRPMLVRPADDLTIAITPNQSQWKPGEEATLDFQVSDRSGHPVLAALGLWVVDEAVFALSELRPGMEQVFFLLEQDIMAPKVEIHGFEPDEVFFFDRRRLTPDANRAPAASSSVAAGRVLAAAAMADFKHPVAIDTGVTQRAASTAFWRAQFDAKVGGLVAVVKRWVRVNWRMPAGRDIHRMLAKAGVKPDVTRDPFGMPYRVTVANDDGEAGEPNLVSAGPDATWGTADDLSANLDVSGAMQPIWDWQQRQEEARWAREPRKFRGHMDFDMAAEDGAGGGGGWGGGMPGIAVMGGGAAVPTTGVRQGVGTVGPERTASNTTPRPDDNAAAAPPTRVRTYFPETLYVNPLVITDANGHAKVSFPMADSITTWRLSSLASTADGRMGSGTQGLKVFQDFFVDVAFPVSLTRNDQVTVPVAVYNYLATPQTVTLDFVAEGSLSVRGDASAKVTLGPGEVKGVSVPLDAPRVGMGRLTVNARGSKLSDAVRREVKVEPDGFAVPATTSGTLDGQVDLALDVPEGAIADASTLQIKLYPGAFAQVVDGLENMLQMPGGCFEQTSSSTFPNILVLRYLRDAKKSKPELEAKALTYLQAGWQRLVTFEVPGGGFSWFGQAPANRILTAYGVMEFFDMDHVFGIDKNVLGRTRQWLMGQQKPDGSWAPDAAFLHQESWGDLQKSSFLVSAYITWALVYTRPDPGALEPALKKALKYLVEHAREADDAYALAYLGNALAAAGSDPSALSSALDRLAAKAVREGDKLYFPTKQRTATYGSGETANIEVTALALRAFMRAGEHLDLLKPGLGWLVSKKDGLGNWQSTQATIQVLQALVSSLGTQQEPTTGVVHVMLNGQSIGDAAYTPDDFDVVRFIDGSKALKTGTNKLSLIPSAGLKAMFAATAVSYLPWTDARRPDKQAFEVSVTYDRTELAKDDLVKVKVSVRSNLPGKAEMGIVDVAVPPGFEVLAEDLEAAVARQSLQRFSLAGRQIILYVPEFKPDAPFELEFRVRARFPVKVSTGTTRAYEYYNPQNAGSATPGTLTVR